MSRPIDPTSIDADEELSDNWVMKKSDALQDVLFEMTSVYAEDNEPVDVRFDAMSRADIDGEFITINPMFWQEVDPPVEGPNILRLLDELNSHEMGHINWSELGSKKEFGEMYPGWGEIPGFVANILEDEYVDAKKMREFYGLRRKRAYRVKLQVDTEHMCPPVMKAYEHGKPNGFLTALHQLALVGAVRGIDEAPPEIHEFCRQVEPVISRVRRQDDPHERFKLFHVVMQVLMRYLDDPEEFDEDEFGDGAGKTVSGEAESAPHSEEVDPEDAMSKPFKDLIEEMIEEMVEEGELEELPDAPSSDSSIVVEMPGDLVEDADTSGGPDGDSESVESAGDDDEDGGSSDAGDDSESTESAGDDDGPPTDADADEEGRGGSGGDVAEDVEDGDEKTDADPDIVEDVSKPEDEMGGEKPPEHDIEGGEATHHIDEDSEISSDMYSGIEERYSIRLDEIDKVDDRDEARWASLVKRLKDYDLDVEERQRERDERIERIQSRFSGTRKKRLHEGLKRRAEDAGVIRDLEEGFRELVSRPIPKPSRQGTRIDPINVARRAAGDVTTTELFEEETIVETGERCVGVATDISGSMSSGIDELKIAGASLAEATQIIGDEFVWEAFTDQRCSRDHSNWPECQLDLRIVTGPDEDFEWEHIDSFVASRNEPTAAGVRDCFNLMQQTDANDYVMIVITDGMALITEDGRDKRGSGEPVEQARQAVNEVRSNGVDVIGLGIGSMDDEKMERTFGGKNHRLTTLDSLANDILELYREQMSVVRQR